MQRGAAQNRLDIIGDNCIFDLFTECDFGLSPLCVTLVKRWYTDGAVVVKNHAVCTIVGLGLLYAAVISGEISAAIINVPADQPTIQAAIDVAVNGDQIRLSEGVFSGPGNRDIEFYGKHLLVSGKGAGLSVIDCGGSEGDPHGGFVFRAGDTITNIIALAITNAYFPLGNHDRGAITLFGGSPLISTCVVQNNHSHGISILGPARPRIIDVVISSNSGWGINMPGYPFLSTGIRVHYCQIDHNAVGGMVLTRAIDSTFVMNNTIVENGGDGLFLQGDLPLASTAGMWDSSTVIAQNVIAFNAKRGIYFMPFFTGVHYQNNLTYANAQGNIFGLNPDTSCMLSVDPLFCRGHSAVEYEVTANSPCRAPNNPCGIDLGAYFAGCATCCVGFPGNVDCDPNNQIDISDLTRMIDFLYVSFTPVCCFDAANMDGSGAIDIADLTALIDYLYLSLVAPPNCFGG